MGKLKYCVFANKKTGELDLIVRKYIMPRRGRAIHKSLDELIGWLEDCYRAVKHRETLDEICLLLIVAYSVKYLGGCEMMTNVDETVNMLYGFDIDCVVQGNTLSNFETNCDVCKTLLTAERNDSFLIPDEGNAEGMLEEIVHHINWCSNGMIFLESDEMLKLCKNCLRVVDAFDEFIENTGYEI